MKLSKEIASKVLYDNFKKNNVCILYIGDEDIMERFCVYLINHVKFRSIRDRLGVVEPNALTETFRCYMDSVGAIEFKMTKDSHIHTALKGVSVDL